MARLLRALGVAAALALLVRRAPAQAPAVPAAAPGPGVLSADTEPASEASAAASAKPVVPATGYTYAPAAPRAERSHPRVARPSPGGIDARMTGFETLADGSTRLFVELSKPAVFEAKPGSRATLTYILKDTRVERRNNENPLVTVHFNTPVTSARLTPHGRDVWLVVDLRARVQPTASIATQKDGAAIVRLDFAKGDYLPSDGARPTAPGSATAPVPPAAKAAPSP